MRTNRRDFLRLSSAAAGYALLAGPGKSLMAQTAAAKASNPKKILILGGTSFLGPDIVEAAIGRGHTMTLFNRGKTNPHLFPELEKLHGDRNGDLKALEGRKWDAVVDTSGYFPRIVKMSAELLRDNAQHYIFISSISAYKDASKPNMDETAPVGTLDDETVEKITGETYGPLKARCEQAAEKAFPGRCTNIRPGLIVGPGDPTDRFTYWPARIARGGEVLAPNSPDDPTQYIDARDLGAWIVQCVEDATCGVFNAVGPKEPFTIGELLASCKRTSKSDATFTWVENSFLEANQVSGWSDLPVWVPRTGDFAGFGTIDNRRAVAKGLRFRPIDETTRDTLKWFNEQPEERRAKLKAGMKAEREKEVLAAWHAHKKK
ncbi:MAG: SDR family oxidoreductase [Phycisphaerae bacterium]